MYKTKLCLGLGDFGCGFEEQIKLFKAVGFDGFFSGWDGNIKNYRCLAKDEGLIYQSIHAPFGNASKMWKETEEGEAAVNELLKCVEDCASVEVPILVIHPYIGFGKGPGATEAGLERFGKLVELSEKLGVKLAFENVEGEEYLAALMNTFADRSCVGFCWDSGHELCYNRGRDMLKLYGDRLIATHLNDNLGVSRFEGEIFWTDDLHLLPFDGITDWKNAASRLNNCGYDGILTFELSKHNKPKRFDNSKYASMPCEEYLAEAYARACRIAYMKNGMDNNL